MATTTIEDIENLLNALEIEAPVAETANAVALYRPLEIARSYLIKLVEKTIPEKADKASSAVQATSGIDQGDLCIILPKLDHSRDAEPWTFELMQEIPPNPLFLLPVPEGSQLRFFLDPGNLSRWLIPFILERGSLYGVRQDKGRDIQDASKRRRVIIESSSPNIASEFHGKHLRSTILGAQLANIHSAFGDDVKTINYLGDWGKPIGLLGAGFERFGSQELLDTSPVTHLHEVYEKTLEIFRPEQAAYRLARDEDSDAAAAEIEATGLFAERNAFFKRMQAGDEKALEFARRFRALSIEQYKDLYGRLGISFDDYSGESQVSQETMDEVLSILESKNLIEDHGGAKAIKAHGGKHGIAIIRDRDGSNTYLLRDIAAVLERDRKYSFDKMIYVVAADSNKVHFLKLFKILGIMGFKTIADKLQHVSFSEASQIPKQNDRDQALTHVLDDCEAAVQKVWIEDALEARQVSGVTPNALCRAAIFARVASVKASVSMTFDIGTLASSESCTGPDLLAWFQCLETTADDIIDAGDSNAHEASLGEQEDARFTLLRLLTRYPEAVDAAYGAAEPAVIMSFVANLITYLRICLPDRKRAATESEPQKQLFQATHVVLGNALKLLGILGRGGNRDSGVDF